ncbi:hypothetical protein BB934_14505 [Microvirga ossetica]|uniref:Uncharacterized protein n=1 Tax=Microvirga ossetica TaxID=1882682 RepID=A0A1B2EH59_9HYPH|nr:hypothetical protein BB934_14505 [Microvirga ossetica]
MSFPAGASAEGKGIHDAMHPGRSPSLAFGSPAMTVLVRCRGVMLVDAAAAPQYPLFERTNISA